MYRYKISLSLISIIIGLLFGYFFGISSGIILSILICLELFSNDDSVYENPL